MNQPETAAIYVRYSPRPNGPCESNDAQAERCRAYVQMRGLREVGLYADELLSGGKPLANRPGGADLVRLLNGRPSGAKHVVIAKLDRAFRNVTDAVDVVTSWQKRGIALHVVDLGGSAIDTGSATGRFMLVILAAVAELERNITSERTRDAHLRSQGLGRLITRPDHAPWGFTAGEPVRLPNGRAYRALVEDGEEVAMLRQMDEWSRVGMSTGDIARALTNIGLSPRRGSWTASKVTHALKGWARFQKIRANSEQKI